MPELPEVETICRQLAPEITGRRIEAVRVLDARWSRPDPPEALIRGTTGRAIDAVTRRGKYILLGFDDGSTLVMHLRMTGNIVIGGERMGGERLYGSGSDTGSGSGSGSESESDSGSGPEPEPPHLRAELVLDDGSALQFTDPRRFGHAHLLPAAGLEPYFASRLGVEPLSGKLTPELIGRIAAGRTAPLKSFLLDQKRIAGIGNIYADEALHRARLHPLSPAGSMRAEHWEDLQEGIIEALELGIRNGGSSIDDYRDARGERGSMQDEFLVHTREGEPCPRCGERVSRIVVGGRSTYFCAACQVRLRKRRRRKSTPRAGHR